LRHYRDRARVSTAPAAVEDVLPYAPERLPKPIIEDVPIYIGKEALAKNIDVVDEISHAYLHV